MLQIIPGFKMSDIDQDLSEFISDMENDAVNALKGTIRELVDRARAKTREEKGFGNITWNLRESIGGVVVKNHAIVDTYFPPIGKGPEGRRKGIAFAEEMALLQDDGQIMAVFVAGEQYGVLVEAKGRDVITGSSLKFESTFKSLLQK
jgi:hypothetical protein